MGNLTEKFSQKSAVIGIIGLGYVGLPLAIRYAEVGYKVVGMDIDENKAIAINERKTYIEHIAAEKIANAVSRGFMATTDFSQARNIDALILCVPTPLNQHREPDLSFIINTLESLLPFIRRDQVISLESTTYPGTCDEELLPRLESTGLKIGSDIYLVYSPEREDPGNPDYSTHTIPKVVGGTTEACLKVGCALYENVIDRIIPVSSTRAAEMTKLLENIHRAVNIGLVNEMKMVADRMGIDIYEVIRAAATKPFGFVPYYPGPGLGGHCIPIDPFYLTWKAKEYGLNTRFIELAGEINSFMPEYVIDKVAYALNNKKKAINGSKILVLGIAYKKDVDDMRESPAVDIMQRLTDRGADIAYSDPHVPTFPRMRKYRFNLSSIDLTPEILASYDCVVLTTDHTRFDYETILEYAQMIIDTRGIFKNDSKVIRA